MGVGASEILPAMAASDKVELIAVADPNPRVLDVFRQEPLPADHPFWTDTRITITPHTAARTLFQETVAQISGKVRALGRGEAISGVVDRVRGY